MIILIYNIDIDHIIQIKLSNDVGEEKSSNKSNKVGDTMAQDTFEGQKHHDLILNKG